jgi:hypothetical protein
MSQDEAQKAKQGMKMMQQGGPGGCKNEEECKTFCDNPNNAQECMNFAVQNGMMSQEDAQKAQQGVMMMQQGGPGGCKGEEECKNYCADASHLNECSNFAVQGGFMTPQEAQTMQQMQQQMQQQAQQVQQQIMQPMQGPFMPWGGEGGGNVPPSGQVPNGQMPMQPPSSEEIEKMKQQGIESGMQQMQQMMPGIQPGMQPGAGMQPGPTMPSGAGGMPPEGTMPGSSGGIAPQQMAPPQQQAPAQEQAPQMSPPPSSVPSPETPPPPQSLLEKFMANILNAAGKIGK